MNFVILGDQNESDLRAFVPMLDGNLRDGVIFITRNASSFVNNRLTANTGLTPVTSSLTGKAYTLSAMHVESSFIFDEGYISDEIGSVITDSSKFVSVIADSNTVEQDNGKIYVFSKSTSGPLFMASTTIETSGSNSSILITHKLIKKQDGSGTPLRIVQAAFGSLADLNLELMTQKVWAADGDRHFIMFAALTCDDVVSLNAYSSVTDLTLLPTVKGTDGEQAVFAVPYVFSTLPKASFNISKITEPHYSGLAIDLILQGGDQIAEDILEQAYYQTAYVLLASGEHYGALDSLGTQMPYKF